MLNCSATNRTTDKKPFDNNLNMLNLATDNLATIEGGIAATKAVSNMFESMKPNMMENVTKISSAFDAVRAANEIINPMAALDEMVSAGK